MEENKKITLKNRKKVIKISEIYRKIELVHSILSLTKSNTENIIETNNNVGDEILTSKKLKILSDIDLAVLKANDVLCELLFEIDVYREKISGVSHERK